MFLFIFASFYSCFFLPSPYLKKASMESYTDCTSSSLNRVSIFELDESLNKANIAKITPSLVPTKKACLKDSVKYHNIPIISEEDYTLAKEDATSENIIAILKKYGICRIKQLFAEHEIDELNHELDPLFKEKMEDVRLYPKETVRVTNTVSKSPLVVNKILSHPTNLAITHKILDESNVFWIGDTLNVASCPATVASSISFQISPNADFQALHRDDQSDHNIRKHQTVEGFDFDTETQVGFSVALTDATKENGATRFIPGSHLWDHLQKPDTKDCLFNEMKKGDATFMLGSVFHSASANTTESEIRRLLILFMGRGKLRKKENIYIGCDIDYYKQFSVEQLVRLGFSMSEPFGNMVELQDPLVLFKPDFERKSNYSDICKVTD